MWLRIAFGFFLFTVAIVQADLLSAEACQSLGFRKETLACSSCEKLKEYVKDQGFFFFFSSFLINFPLLLKLIRSFIACK